MTLWVLDIQHGEEGTLIRLYGDEVLVATRDSSREELAAFGGGHTALALFPVGEPEIYVGKHRPETVVPV